MPPKREPVEYRIVAVQDIEAVRGFGYDEAVWLPGVKDELERTWPDGRREWAPRLPACKRAPETPKPAW